MTTFTECAEKHASNLRAAAKDLIAAGRDDAASARTQEAELHRAAQGAASAAGILEAIAEGAYKPTTHRAD